MLSCCSGGAGDWRDGVREVHTGERTTADLVAGKTGSHTWAPPYSVPADVRVKQRVAIHTCGRLHLYQQPAATLRYKIPRVPLPSGISMGACSLEGLRAHA
jgi:hypothetical protein